MRLRARGIRGILLAQVWLLGFLGVMLLPLLAAEAGWIASLLGSERTLLVAFVNAMLIGATTGLFIGLAAVLLLGLLPLVTKRDSFTVSLGRIPIVVYTSDAAGWSHTYWLAVPLLFAVLVGLLGGFGALLLRHSERAAHEMLRGLRALCSASRNPPPRAGAFASVQLDQWQRDIWP